MNLRFVNKKISGVLVVMPSNEIRFEDEYGHNKLQEVMGYNARRVVNEGVCVSDMCCTGLNYLFEYNYLKKDEIDALILITQSPDYMMPATSFVIHGRLGLKKDTLCMDISQGCAGYIIGLFQAFMLLEQESINKVVLLNADILSRKTSRRDRNSNPLMGDAASVTIVEKGDKDVAANIFCDGSQHDALIIPAGGFRMPSTEETSREYEDAAGNYRSADNLVMKGDAVFNFIMAEVPKMVGWNVDYYMFHQPNRFILKKLADKMKIPYDKMPNNIVEHFGNASGVSIPTNIVFNLSERLMKEELNLCLAGFGVGLTWGSICMRMGRFDFCEMIEI